MSGQRLAAVLGASAAFAAGVAYFIWSSVSSSGKEAETEPGGEVLIEPVKEEDAAVVQSEALTVQSEALIVQSEALIARSDALIAQTEALVVQSDAVLVQSEALKEEELPEVEPEAETPKVGHADVSKVSSKSDSEGDQVLVLGLDGAGKTSLLHCLSTGSPDQDMTPTEGFNAVSINREGLHIEFLEIGGKENLRPYWQKYLSKAQLLVFVVDASNPELLPVAKTHLHQLLAVSARLPLMVLANKQDISSALSITDVHDALSLSEVGDRQLYLIGTYVRKGEAELSSGVQDARDLLIQLTCGGK